MNDEDLKAPMERYTIHLHWNGERYEARIPEIHADAYGKTIEEVLHYVELVIVAVKRAEEEEDSSEDVSSDTT